MPLPGRWQPLEKKAVKNDGTDRTEHQDPSSRTVYPPPYQRQPQNTTAMSVGHGMKIDY
jgi:hypothetical protein